MCSLQKSVAGIRSHEETRNFPATPSTDSENMTHMHILSFFIESDRMQKVSEDRQAAFKDPRTLSCTQKQNDLIRL